MEDESGGKNPQTQRALVIELGRSRLWLVPHSLRLGRIRIGTSGIKVIPERLQGKRRYGVRLSKVNLIK